MGSLQTELDLKQIEPLSTYRNTRRSHQTEVDLKLLLYMAPFFCSTRSHQTEVDLKHFTEYKVEGSRGSRVMRRLVINEDDEADEDTDVSTAMQKERERLIRLYRDPRRREQLEAERIYIRNYIFQLRRISTDSKFEVFNQKLSDLLNKGHRVIVFTQYLDTLDFIRECLESRFGNKMACYSGRGGEIWNPDQNRWTVVEKSEIKSRAKKDHPSPIQILLGTDAASEGLNLQQFSALINYDLPWNPMRVEQRIGRIDRIGQEAPSVHIINLYVEDTIEQDTYETLKNRIGAFEEVVGPPATHSG